MSRFSFYNSQEQLYSNFQLVFLSLFKNEDSRFTICPLLQVYYQGNAINIIAGSQFRYLLNESSIVTRNQKSTVLVLGTSYRITDAIMLSVNIEQGDYNFGLAYDANISSLYYSSKSFGSIEIIFRRSIRSKKI